MILGEHGGSLILNLFLLLEIEQQDDERKGTKKSEISFLFKIRKPTNFQLLCLHAAKNS